MFFFLIYYSSSYATAVLFLYGTGSVGKSSLCKALVQHDPSRILIDEDELYCQGVLLFFKNVFSSEFSFIENAIAVENIFHAIVRKQIVFKKDATDQEKTDALVAIYSTRKRLDQLLLNNAEINKQWRHIGKSISDCALSLTNQNSTLIVDSIGIVSPEGMEKAGCTIVRILVYCPFKDIVNRTIRRNTDALLSRNLLSMRYYSYLLTSFMRAYDFNEQPDGAIDTITKEEVNNTLDLVALLLPTQENITNFTRAEFNQVQLNEYRTYFMKKFVNTETLYIVPKDKIDFCVRTDQNDGADLLKYIDNHLNSF